MSDKPKPDGVLAEIATLIRSNSELQSTLAQNERRQEEREQRRDKRDEETKGLLDKLIDAQVQLQLAVTKQEERQAADRDWQKAVEKHQDKQDERIDSNHTEFEVWKRDEFQPVRDGQRRNSLITNGVVGVGGTLLGVLISTLFWILRS